MTDAPGGNRDDTTPNGTEAAPTEPPSRAEEVIVEVYRQRRAIVDRGGAPAFVILSPAHYRLVQEYHARLGDAPEGRPDYIGRYRLFDLEIRIERIDQPVVGE